MKTDLSPARWKVLRALIRHGGPCQGWKLRLTPGRASKDGTFLTDMVAAGLLEDGGACVPPSPDIEVTDAIRVPGPFHRFYKITPLGLTAAEYGEYVNPEVPPCPPQPPAPARSSRSRQ